MNKSIKYFQVCPSPSPAAVGGRACAALHPPGGGPRRGEGGPRQALPPLSATGPHLESHQGRLSKPASDTNHPYFHQKWISPCLPSASVGPLASCHPALRLRQTGTGGMNPTLSREIGKTWRRCAPPTRSPSSSSSSTHWSSTPLRSKSLLSSEVRWRWWRKYCQFMFLGQNHFVLDRPAVHVLFSTMS